MVDLKDKKLNKKLEEVEKQKVPSLEKIKEENRELVEKEQAFLKKFRKK
jgi:hypothetical protein